MSHGGQVLCAFDTPTEWIALEGVLEFSGWLCCGEEVSAIRARVGGEVFSCNRGLPRPDVAKVYPELLGSETSGFSGRVSCAPGVAEVVWEFVRPGQDWEIFHKQSIKFGLARLSGCLDTPREGTLPAGMVLFSGWCLHPQFAVTGLVLKLGRRRMVCEYGLCRDDVAAVFPKWPGYRRAGFALIVECAPGRRRLGLEAELSDGSTLELDLERSLQVRPLPLAMRFSQAFGLARIRNGLIFAVECSERFRAWRRKNGYMPHFAELAQIARDVWRDRQSVAHTPPPGLQPPDGFVVPEPEDPFGCWLQVNRQVAGETAQLVARLNGAAEKLPRISVIMPVYNPPRPYFEAAVASVRNQVYPEWELCIADDCSTAPWVGERLAVLANEEPRIRVVFRNTNGNISRATNSAARLARGNFLAFLDQDDLLSPDALAEVALHLAANPKVDLLYSDDDKIDDEGRRFDPQFKPDWSPELLLSYMYFSHLLVVRCELFERVGGVREGFEGSQDYDFGLRASEQARQIAHLPYILYHWRVLSGSTAASGDAKPNSFEAGRRAVAEALARRGVDAEVYRPDWAVKGALGIFWHEFPDRGPSVVIIVPSKNQRSLLERCIRSLEATSYRDFRVVVIDNQSDEPGTLKYLRGLRHQVLRIPNPDGAFSFAHINNRAAEQLEADYLLFLNDDTEIRDPKWLSRMVGYARLPGVGAVGARLLYADGRVQHAGVVHGYYDGMAGPAHKLLPDWHHGYLSYAMVARNYSAVTAACMLTSRQLFLEQGGFDERGFAVAFNDVDYCYRLVDAGWRCVFAPGAELNHYEGFSRGFDDDPREVLRFRRKYAHRRDPYYNPNLSLLDEQFRIQPRRLVRAEVGRPIPALMCAFNLLLEGAPFSQFEMTLELAKRGLLAPVVFSPSDGPLRRAYEQAGIQVIVDEHPLTGVFEREAYDLAVDRFANRILELEVQLVYGNTLQAFYAIDAASRVGLPSVWNVRESEPWQTYFDFLAPPLAARALECFRIPYRIVFVAHATRHQFEVLNSQHNFTVVHNGLSPTRLGQHQNGSKRESARLHLGLKDGEQLVLLLGTVCARKGQQDLVMAMMHIREQSLKRMRVVIVGDRPGAYSNELHTLIEGLPEERRARISVEAETEDTSCYYAAADLFVCTSRVESYPRVILEAMAHGLPIVTTPAYGIQEQVREGINGDFYQAGNARDLGKKIDALLSDTERFARYRDNAPLVLESLTSFEEMVDQYGGIFSECASLEERALNRRTSNRANPDPCAESSA